MNQPMEPISASVQDAGEREPWIALVVLCAGFLMTILDQTIVNIALPSIQSDLHFSQSSLAWVVNAYLVAFGGLLWLEWRSTSGTPAASRIFIRPRVAERP